MCVRAGLTGAWRNAGIIKGLGEDHLQLTDLKIKQKKWSDKGAEEDIFTVKWKNPNVRCPCLLLQKPVLLSETSFVPSFVLIGWCSPRRRRWESL
jgi:hypothetical protein